jgi:hypothetical protein
MTMHAVTVGRAFAASAAVILTTLGGWMSVRPMARGATRTVEPAPMAAPPARLPSPTWASAPVARGARRITPDIRIPEPLRQILELDPVVAARQSVDATREGKRADCKRKLPHASDEYCERILQVDGRTGVKFIDIQQRFLTGKIDQDTYQSEMHKTFLEHEIALEQFMPPRDFLAHEGLQSGEDIFMAVMAEFQSLPPGYKMGDELFDPSINPFGSAPHRPAPAGEPPDEEVSP